MVKFNELAITTNGEVLIIDASVLDLPYYANVYISDIFIDTQDTFTEGGPSSRAINVYRATENVKNARVELNSNSLLPSLDNNLFFVYVKTSGTPAANTPCGMDNIYTIGVIFSKCPIYNNIMQHMKETYDNCNIPKKFIDSYLRFKALELSINTEHYPEAIIYYNKFFRGATINISSNCNCHG